MVLSIEVISVIKMTKDFPPIDEVAVLDSELELIAHARARFGGSPSPDEIRASKSALCLSGGGIRSAIFCLGGLMALDRSQLIHRFDYLSTVSGGGYIGSWLSKLLKVIGDDSVNAKTRIFKPVGLESEDSDEGISPDPNCLKSSALDFLRENSSYLTPQKGALSGDTWAIVAIYLRNVLLNWIILLPFLSAVLASPLCFVGLLCLFVNGNLAVWASGFFAVLSLYYPTRVPALADVPQNEAGGKTGNRSSEEDKRFREMSLNSFLWQRLLPYVLALFFFTHWVFLATDKATQPLSGAGQGWVALVVSFGFGGPFLLLLAKALFVSLRPVGVVEKRMDPRTAKWIFFLQSLGSLCAIPLATYLVPVIGLSNLWLYVWFPAVGTLIFLVAGTLFAGLVDPLIQDDNREWWARSAGYFLLFVVVWAILGSVCLGIPWQVKLASISPAWDLHLNESLRLPKNFDPKLSIPVVIVSGAIAYYTRLVRELTAETKKLKIAGEWTKRVTFIVAITIFSFTVAIILLSVTLSVVAALVHEDPSRVWLSLLIVTASLLLVSFIASIPVNINRFSAHIAYRNRLVRTFLGASNIGRKYNPFTGFSQTDNLPLYLLTGSRVDQKTIDEISNGIKPKIEKPSQRPFHVLCAAVNISHGERLAWQERRAVSFTFSGLHCGGRDFGYRSSRDYGGPRGISLGTAMAISGAAANSGMGFYTSPIKSFLLTLLNARLGWWLGNPKCARESRRESPLIAFNPLLKELFSLTGMNYCWLNASDGGHFDNTGVYEMLRRKCRWIVLFDAETERKGMSNAARRARVDFDAELKIIAKGDKSFPCDYYQIRYPGDSKEKPGGLLRIFPAIVDECAWTGFENWFYKTVDKAFPDDSLLNQFFTETAFESYRLLGLQTVATAFAEELFTGKTDWEHLFRACLKKLKSFEPDSAPLKEVQRKHRNSEEAISHRGTSGHDLAE
jgi:hypothetical protein